MNEQQILKEPLQSETQGNIMIIKEIRDFSISQIADSGQCFRINNLGSGTYSVIAFDKYLEVTDLGDNRFGFSCSEEDFLAVWADYFDLSADYRALKNRIPQDDAFLTAAAAYGWGMRILRQDPWEITASFIISQRKSIPAIKSAIESMCSNFGIQKDSGGKKYYTFPSAKSIACLCPDDIGCCSLGYRDKYITAAARNAADGRVDFAQLQKIDAESAKTVLKSLYGVGEKVANCILLFGLGHTNAFPEDTWIKRIIDSEYGGSFSKDIYDGHLGIIQQYMFYYARSNEYRNSAPLNKPGT